MYGEVTIYAFFIAAACALAIMWWDLKTMTIPNWLVGVTGAAFLALLFFHLPMDDVIDRLVGGAVVFAVGLLMWFTSGIGGGDVKAAAVFALLIAPPDRGVVLVLLAIFGLIGVALLWGLRKTALANGSWAVWTSGKSFPYAVALSATLITYMALTVIFLR